MFTFLTAIILGIVEGITEFLPISSTGHLILTAKFLNLPQTEFLKSFEIIIQLGAILAVIAFYWRKILLDKIMFLKLSVAFLPTVVAVLFLYSIIKRYLLGNTQVVVLSLFVGGLLLVIFELFHKENKEQVDEVENISFKDSFVIGVAQTVALIPGVSRSAATILTGMLLGYKRKTVVEFSFLLAIPTMLAATGFELIKNYQVFNQKNIGLLIIGFCFSALTAFLAIMFLLKFVQKRTFIIFGVYRIVIALILFKLFF